MVTLIYINVQVNRLTVDVQCKNLFSIEILYYLPNVVKRLL